jgi:hypothetical protein
MEGKSLPNYFFGEDLTLLLNKGDFNGKKFIIRHSF